MVRSVCMTSDALGHGAVALVDCLGFKGIWSRYSPQDLLAQMKLLRRETLQFRGAGNVVIGTHRYLRNEIRFMSDTVVITSRIANNWNVPVAPYASVYRVSQIAAHLVWSALCAGIPMSFRGCITYGKFIAEDQFLLGPAIDEAASLEREAEGAFVWLAPSGLAVCKAEPMELAISGRLEPDVMLPWSIPLKGGRSYDTLALHFGVTHMPATRWNEILVSLKSTFLNSNGVAPSFEVEIKRQNTLRYLAYLEHSRDDIGRSRREISGYGYSDGKFTALKRSVSTEEF